MADMFDYLSWRGDIPFSQVPPGAVDSLIFSSLCYIQFEGIVPTTPHRWIRLEEAALAFLSDPKALQKVRVDQDLELLAAAAACPRFQNVGMSFYRDVFIPEEDTQFAALGWYLDDGSAFLSFRGTDYTLVGWKEAAGPAVCPGILRRQQSTHPFGRPFQGRQSGHLCRSQERTSHSAANCPGL